MGFVERLRSLKEQGLGDYEDAISLVIPGLRYLWADLGHLTPDTIRKVLDQKKQDQAEKAMEKVEILGQSLNARLTIILTTAVELFLMVYLLAHLIVIRTRLSGNEMEVSEFPFFAIMCSLLGRLVMLFTLFLIPFGVCGFVGIAVFPHFLPEFLTESWHGVESNGRHVLIAAIGFTGIILISLTSIIAKDARSLSLSKP